MARPAEYVTVTAEVPRTRKDALEAAKKGDGYSASLRLGALIALWESDPQLQAATTEKIAAVQTERRLATQSD